MFSSNLQEWRKQSLFCPALSFYITEVDFEFSFVLQTKNKKMLENCNGYYPTELNMCMFEI